MNEKVSKRIKEIDKELDMVFRQWANTKMLDIVKINKLALKKDRLNNEKRELEKEHKNGIEL